MLRVGDYSRQITRVMARLPDAEEARLLRQPRNRPVLVTKAVSADIDGEPIEFGIARFASDCVQILVESWECVALAYGLVSEASGYHGTTEPLR